ncbi:hypothetical protein SNEBB_003829 [Seison nebaliae]|nr:hypothetical protein SNEBB_003829 [Seison nebaliae]
MLPLNGIRIVDMSRVLAGPFCSMLLADLGAEIIKIEKFPDITRSWGPPFTQDGTAVYFQSINRNKKSLALNFQEKEGREIIKKLVKKSDILLENFIPKKLEKYHLHFQSLKQLNDKLIYCSISGFGPSGPYSNRGGYDLIAAAMGGFLHLTGKNNGEPCRAGVALTDITTGLYCLTSILSALNRKDKRAIHINTNLFDSQLTLSSRIIDEFKVNHRKMERGDNLRNDHFIDEIFLLQNGTYVVVTCNEGEWKLFLQTFEIDEKENMEEIRKKIKKMNLSQLANYSMLKVTKVQNFHEIFNNNPMITDRIFTTDNEKIRTIGTTVPFNGNFSNVNKSAPRLGENTREILETIIGKNSDEINSLISRGICFE